MRWKCPNCGSGRLSVMVCVSADLTQHRDNFETEPTGDHEWDGDSLMTCKDCSHCDASRGFDREITEEQALARLLRHMAKLGWEPEEVFDGEEPVDLAGKTIEQVVEECAAVEDCHIQLVKGGQRGTLYIVWGNSPMELVADSSMRHGFDEAIDAATASIWPGYKLGDETVAPEVH